LYTAWERKKDTEEIVEKILSENNLPIIVWGTGLYIDTIYKNFDMPDVEPDFELRKKLYEEEETNPWILYKRLQEVDPLEAQKLHPHTLRYIVRALEIYYKTGKPKSELAKQRPVKWPLLMIWLWREKEDTNKRINKRIKKQIESGLVDEVKWLLDQGYSPDLQSMQGLGYKEIVWYLQWKYDLDKAVEILKRNTHRYAKRQRTWFRRYIAESKQAPRQNVKYLFYNLTD
jgi:tRNA dimethylallyltransferase